MQIIERIVSSVGRRIDESSPMVDARLPDGSRVNAIIPPLALDGPVLSIRRFRTDRLGAEDLVERAVADRSRCSTSWGRGRRAAEHDHLGRHRRRQDDVAQRPVELHLGRERIVTIEDAAELLLRQPHVVRLETRPANIEGKGEVAQRELVINALRMRPDRIIVGEVRGDEALDMLQAMNTGHDGSLTTIHANSPRDALDRLEMMVAMADFNLPEQAIRQQIASAVHVVVQVARLPDGPRRVTAISEITGMERGRRHDAGHVRVRADRADADGKVTGRFRATGIRPKCAQRLASAGFTMPPEMFEHRSWSVKERHAVVALTFVVVARRRARRLLGCSWCGSRQAETRSSSV